VSENTLPKIPFQGTGEVILDGKIAVGDNFCVHVAVSFRVKKENARKGVCGMKKGQSSCLALHCDYIIAYCG